MTRNLIETNQQLREEKPHFKSFTTQSQWKNVKTKADLIVACLLCDTQFPVKYNALKKQYSQKNNWNYWTSKPSKRAKYVCDTCLMRLHHGSSMRAWITDETKADTFYNYVYQGVLKSKV